MIASRVLFSLQTVPAIGDPKLFYAIGRKIITEKMQHINEHKSRTPLTIQNRANYSKAFLETYDSKAAGLLKEKRNVHSQDFDKLLKACTKESDFEFVKEIMKRNRSQCMPMEKFTANFIRTILTYSLETVMDVLTDRATYGPIIDKNLLQAVLDENIRMAEESKNFTFHTLNCLQLIVVAEDHFIKLDAKMIDTISSTLKLNTEFEGYYKDFNKLYPN